MVVVVVVVVIIRIVVGHGITKKRVRCDGHAQLDKSETIGEKEPR